MKITQTIEVEVEVDLLSLPLADWPQTARQAALAVLTNPRAVQACKAELPELRKSWLVTRVERHLTLAQTSLEEVLK